MVCIIFTTEDPNLLGELSVAGQRYEKALDTINARSKLHLNEVQPKLEKAGIIEGGDYSPEDIEQALGNRLFLTIQQSTSENKLRSPIQHKQKILYGFHTLM